MQNRNIFSDIVIIGGGIAGLWLLNDLKNQNKQVILLEKNELGSGQTIKSQGIIHGGLKYALDGSISKDLIALQDIPKIWQECLDGKSNINLSNVNILAKKQYLFATNSIASKVSNFFASKTLSSNTSTLKNIPEIFKENNIKSVYQLDETILDVNSLITELSKPYLNSCIKIDNLSKINNNNLKININNTEYNITANKFIFTCGEGNNINQSPNMQMQLRPLHMVLVKSNNLPKIYAHCIGASKSPRITISSHSTLKSETVWYLGGKIAEDGINLTKLEQIQKAKNELKNIFPKLNLENSLWHSFMVNRAETKQNNFLKPASFTIHEENNIITAFPTKLALAPALSKSILNKLNINNNFTAPNIAKLIWDEKNIIWE